MPLGADDHIAVVDFHELHKDAYLFGMQLHVRVDEGDRVARGALESVPKRKTLAHIRRVTEDLHVRPGHCERLLVRIVRAAIADDDHFVFGANRVEGCGQLAHVGRYLRPFHVGGHNHRKHQSDFRCAARLSICAP